MSIKLMTEAWKINIPSSAKLVLLSLCDNANDQGECYPSILHVSERCSMSVRSVQIAVNKLTKLGIVSRQDRRGRSNLFFIADPRRWCTPAESAPPQNLHPTPAESAPQPPQNLHPTPAESAPRTVNEPSIETSMNLQPSNVSREMWIGFLDMRKKIKAPLTDYAAELLTKKLAEIGGDSNAVLGQSIMNGWKGVFPVKTEGGNKPDKIQRNGFEQNEYLETI